MKKEAKKFNLSVIDSRSYNPTLAYEGNYRNGEFIQWGIDNKYPYYLLDIYENCATLQSIINRTIDYVGGNGIIDNINLPYFQHTNQFGETTQDIVDKVNADYNIFNGFAIQVLFNKMGEPISHSWKDFARCRTDLNREWVYTMTRENSNYGANNAVKTRRFIPGNTPELKRQRGEDGIQIYHFNGKNTRTTYPKPVYYAALCSAETQIKIQKFHYNELDNNFLTSAIITFNGAPPEESEQKKIEQEIIDKFTGEGKNARILLVWDQGDGETTKVERLSSDDFDKRYQALAESTRENIFIAVGGSPQLFGLNQSTGFNEQEYQEAFKLYNKTKCIPTQQEIVRAYLDIFGKQVVNGVETDPISFKPFDLEQSNQVEKPQTAA